MRVAQYASLSIPGAKRAGTLVPSTRPRPATIQRPRTRRTAGALRGSLRGIRRHLRYGGSLL